jgi:phospholipid transport system transporter-binding protein
MLVCDAGRCTVQGPLTMSNVTAVLEQSRALFKGPQTVVDLAGVTEVDSAALSLLLEWRRLAAAEKRAIEYRNFPANLRTLADLYGVSGLLPAS